MSAIEAVEWLDCPFQRTSDTALSRQVRDELGLVPPWVGYFDKNPWIVQSAVHTDHMRGGLASIDLDLAEWLMLVVSQDNSCRFCFAAHRLLMRVLGTPESHIRRLEQDLFAPDLPARERAAFDFARKLSRANPLSTRDDLARLVEAGWSDDAAREIAAITALFTYWNRIATFPALPPARMEALPERWYLRLAAPLGRSIIRRRFRRGVRTPLTPSEGPFAYVVRALDGLPFAAGLRATVDGAWGQTALGQRAKGLVFAVVARGLGDPLAEAEAARLLEKQGVDRARLDAILAHLGAPDLDPRDAAAVTFARETIRYRPADIQRRVRDLRGIFDQPQLLDLIGVSALANMLGRLGAAVAG